MYLKKIRIQGNVPEEYWITFSFKRIEFLLKFFCSSIFTLCIEPVLHLKLFAQSVERTTNLLLLSEQDTAIMAKTNKQDTAIIRATMLTSSNFSLKDCRSSEVDTLCNSSDTSSCCRKITSEMT